MNEVVRRYPIGIQTFSKLREGGYVYIDKSEYVYRLTNGDMSYVFLSRPRRFGKSLLTSTLHSYFSGRKELFAGLKIESLEKEWKQYPVLHFDMGQAKHMDVDRLNNYLIKQLELNEQAVGAFSADKDVSLRLSGLIRKAYQKYNTKVVVLIDEYDAPLLDVAHEEENLPKLRQVMRNFYSPLKACDPYLRFVFFTGITKFSQLSVFSELNNIKNISMLPEFSGICGITKDELTTQMKGDIEEFADRYNVSYDKMLQSLKENYDGYHFSWPSEDIFNPFSILNSFVDKRLDSYWFASGTPTYIIELLKKFNILPTEIGASDVTAFDFDIPLEQATNLLPLLYQAGYLTIKDGDPTFGFYTLGIPNKEVRNGLMRSLIPYYIQPDTQPVSSTLVRMFKALLKDDMDEMLRLLQTFLATVPQCDNTDYEGHYQQVLYIIFTLLGTYCDVEVRTSHGRVDMVMHTSTRLYLLELKLNRNAETAMKQIDLKEYDKRFALYKEPVVKVAVNFSTETRNITDWIIS